MKKHLILIPIILFMSAVTAAAKTIYTEGAKDYSDALNMAYGSSDMRGFSVATEDAALNRNASRTLLVHYEGGLEDKSALYDICDEYDIHTLIYADSDAADSALLYYTENGYDVSRDEILTVASLSWGYNTVGTYLFTQGLTATYGSVLNMPEIKIAVIDSGVDYNHSFLRNRVDTSRGYDFYNGDYDPMDDNSHGTHVAGIITDNTLSNVTIIPIKVTNSNGSMTTTDLKSGIQWAINKNVNIINLSLGALAEDRSQSSKSTFSSVFNSAHNKGITMCVAAGNASYGVVHNANYIFPAYMNNTIVVANCTSNGSISSSSNYGTVIDVSAPGAGIYSTIPNNDYGYMSGTSMSTPFVSAAAALLKTRNPYITPNQIENEIKSNTTPYSAQYEDEYYGKYGTGILNLSNYYIEPDPSAPPTPIPTARPTPAPTAVPTATPEPGTQQLISEIKYTGEQFEVLISGPNKILKDSAVALAVGYKNGVFAAMDHMSIRSDDDAMFHARLKNVETFDYVTIFVWDSFEGAKPLSKKHIVNVVKTDNGKYEVQTLKE